MATRLRMGMDENGLGPRLGPMIVTSVLARVSDDGDAVATRKPRGALAKRLGDSKEFVSHGDTVLGEAWARALARRVGLDDLSPDSLVHALSIDPRAELRRECPSHVESQCWNAKGEAFEADADIIDTLSADLARLATKGVDLIGVRTTIVCTQKLNAARSFGKSRFDLDLHAMERMMLEAREQTGTPIDGVCGRVGGYTRYSNAFGPLAGRLHAIVEEGPKQSTYSFPGLGTVSFVRDADERHLLVAMASMVGKWVREVLMARIIRFYGAHDPDLPTASGYHDPVTARFVQATALVRKQQTIPETCFERSKDLPLVRAKGA